MANDDVGKDRRRMTRGEMTMKMMTTRTTRGWLCASCGAVALTLAMAGATHAQVTTAPDGRSTGQTLDIQVGQTATLDLAVTSAVSELVVTARSRVAVWPTW